MQHVPHSYTVQEIQQAVIQQPQGAYVKGSCGRKWLSSEQNNIKYFWQQETTEVASITVKYMKTQVLTKEKNLPVGFLVNYISMNPTEPMP